LIYYVDGDFMSRKNVTRGMITLHPAGIPHGPHPVLLKKVLVLRNKRISSYG
jgi:homogentisate 1,2-dioxygenase